MNKILGSNREIYDTGDLSGSSLAYNNITFHVYPVLGFTNEQKERNSDETK